MADEKANDRVRVAFWRYDLFPFVLGGEGEFTADGDFRAFSYGSTFRRDAIICVFPLEEGRTKLEELKRLRSGYERQQREMQAEALGKAYAVLPQLKEWRQERGYKP